MKPLLWIPVAGAALFVGYAFDQHDANEEADAFARKVAGEMQAACTRDARCPESPEGWQAESDGGFTTELRGLRVDYRAIRSRSEFHLTAHHRVGSFLALRGGVGLALTERDSYR